MGMVVLVGGHNMLTLHITLLVVGVGLLCGGCLWALGFNSAAGVMCESTCAAPIVVLRFLGHICLVT